MTAERSERSILHVDMDAFFASVELLRYPELSGRPVIVGGSGERGVVAAASYEARSYGVRSAMPSVRARRLCPEAIFLDGDHAHYREISTELMAIFQRWTPLVEPLSLDEAFLDLTGSLRILGNPVEAALRLRHQVFEETSLHCSIGLARNKFLAKLATGYAKPKATRQGPLRGTGVFHLDTADEREFLSKLPVERIWGVGPATLEKLSAIGIRTAGDLSEVHPSLLSAAVGAGAARRLSELAKGVDERPVEPASEPKSISHEETFSEDISDVDELRTHLVRQADGVATRLRAHELRAKTIHLKLRYGTFETVTRSRSVQRSTDSGNEILKVAVELLERLPVERGVRLLGVGVSSLGSGGSNEQLSFEALGDSSERDQRPWDKANSAVDQIRERFGATTIGPASLSGRHRGVGDHQWGPTDPG